MSIRRVTRTLAVGAIALTAAVALGACSSNFSSPSSSSSSGKLTSSKAKLTVLIAASGPAENASVKEAVAKWSKETGQSASVENSSDFVQQMSQGFASGKPADVFYASADQAAGWAKSGSLLAYGDQLKNKNDFYPSLRQAFTVNNQFMCAPKDFSTLALFINKTDWKAAGLSDSDIPTTWDQLESVAKKLTMDGHVGLTMSPQYERLGAFMAQAGGTLTNAKGTEATADSAANVKALDYIKQLLASGSTKFSSDLGESWGGDAFGKGKAAMTVEGNWLNGAMSATYPSIDYQVVPLPKGPQGEGTLQYTNCWGVAKASTNQAAAVNLVEYLTSTQQQLTFSKQFGVMPSIESAAEEWKQQYPQYSAFINEASYAKSVPTGPGVADVITDFDSKLSSLSTQDPKTLLEGVQKNLAAALKQ